MTGSAVDDAIPTAEGVRDTGASARDAGAAAILGWFLVALALPVLVGIGFADLLVDRVLNAAGAAVLAAVGAFFLWRSRRLARRSSRTTVP